MVKEWLSGTRGACATPGCSPPLPFGSGHTKAALFTRKARSAGKNRSVFKRELPINRRIAQAVPHAYDAASVGQARRTAARTASTPRPVIMVSVVVVSYPSQPVRASTLSGVRTTRPFGPQGA